MNKLTMNNGIVEQFIYHELLQYTENKIESDLSDLSTFLTIQNMIKLSSLFLAAERWLLSHENTLVGLLLIHPQRRVLHKVFIFFPVLILRHRPEIEVLILTGIRVRIHAFLFRSRIGLLCPVDSLPQRLTPRHHQFLILNLE